MTSDTSKALNESKEASLTAVAKPRKRSKWDQAAEPFTPATGPLTINGTAATSIPGVIPAVSSSLTNPIPATYASPQLKVQDELIAREIVINDAEPNVRCKLTKRQTQEEIQKSTGAVVVTRGKYRPPNALPDGEKPLYLHISAGSHLKDVVERIRAVDKAASIVDDMLKQSQVAQPFTTCVFLGFAADPSLNVSSRIRGPNDQFINHIINETGASVVLRGRDSGNISSDAEELSQPLHLFLSSANATSLESARILAENLLDTIAAECGASRIQSYVIPPPPLPSSALAVPVPVLPGVPPTVPILPPPHTYPPPLATPLPQTTVPPYFTNPLPTSGTRYNGYYEGIYPQATPLQQVALALKQASPATITPATASVPVAAAPASSVASGTPSMSSSSSSSMETNKRPTQKRKFQELPVSVSRGSTVDQQNLRQGSEFFKPGLEEINSNSRRTNSTTMPPPRKLVEAPTNEMMAHRSNAMMPPPPPPPKSVMPPPKFSSIKPPSTFKRTSSSSSKPDLSLSPPIKPRAEKLQAEPASETLLKLVEYGEEEDDDEPDQAEISVKSNSNLRSGPKPFWAA